MNLYIPFCAPFLKGTYDSCDDPEIGKYLYNESGKGYAAGSDEEKAYQRLRKMPVAIVTDEVLREICLQQFHKNNAAGYLELIDKYRDMDAKAKEERVSCASDYGGGLGRGFSPVAPVQVATTDGYSLTLSCPSYAFE